jgi:membrane protein
VLYSSRLTVVYAGFAIIVAALLWTYLGWIIMLLGAQLSFYLQNPSYLRLGLRQLQLSGADNVRLALGIMYLVASDHQRGRNHWTISKLASQLGMPGNTIARLYRQLEAAGLLTDTRGVARPARDLAHIPLMKIIRTVYHHGSSHLLSGRQLPPRVEALSERLEQAWEQYCAGRSLADLVTAAEDRPPIP